MSIEIAFLGKGILLTFCGIRIGEFLDFLLHLRPSKDFVVVVVVSRFSDPRLLIDYEKNALEHLVVCMTSKII